MVDIFEQIITRMEQSMHVLLLSRLFMDERTSDRFVCKLYEQIFNNVRR